MVTARGDRVVVESYSRTEDALWVANGHFEILTEPVSDSGLGRAVLAALEVSDEGILTPDWPLEPRVRPVVRALGLSSERAFMKGAVAASVDRTADELRLTPTTNRPRGGFVRKKTGATEIAGDPSAAELGAGVRRALEASD